MFRLLITFCKSFAGGGAVATTTVVTFDSKDEAEIVFSNVKQSPNYQVEKLYDGRKVG